MPDPIAGWCQVTVKRPGHLGNAERLYQHISGAHLGRFNGWSSNDKREEVVYWWELHYGRSLRMGRNSRAATAPPFTWANKQMAEIERDRAGT